MPRPLTLALIELEVLKTALKSLYEIMEDNTKCLKSLNVTKNAVEIEQFVYVKIRYEVSRLFGYLFYAYFFSPV